MQTALQLISQDSYFTSIDLWDEYYSIKVHKDVTNILCCFQAAAMGLASVPRKFIKLTKTIHWHIRMIGVMSSRHS